MTTEARATIKAALDLGLQAWRTTSSRERFLKAHDAVDALASELAATQRALADVLGIVDAQAEDEILWAVYPMGKQPIAEAYLQQELRRLHEAVERAAALASGSAAEGDTE